MLALEYVAKFIIYLLVVMVVATLFWKFFVSTKVCFFNCEKPSPCDIETQVVDEVSIDGDKIDKYCLLCKKKASGCKKNVLCYVVNGEFDPSSLQGYVSAYEYCELNCRKKATSLLFTYDWVRETVVVEC